MDKKCIRQLQSGLSVYNLCSEYPVHFDDGTVVAAQQAEVAERLKAREENHATPLGAYGTIHTKSVELTVAIEDALDSAQEWADLFDGAAIILVPYAYLVSRDFNRDRWPSAYAVSLPQHDSGAVRCDVFRQEP